MARKYKRLRRSFCLIEITLLGILSGCAQWYWVSDNQPLHQLDSTILECNEGAYKLFPPHVIQSVETNYAAKINNMMLKLRQEEYERQLVHYQNSLNNRSWTANTSYNSWDDYSRSTTTISPSSRVLAPTPPTGTYIPETEVVSRDTNQDARNTSFKKCMYDKGWRLKLK